MKLFQIFIATYGTLLLFMQSVFAADAPTINCFGLPGCDDQPMENPSGATVIGGSNNSAEFIVNIISTVLQYVTVVAVITVMISGVMYLLSGGEEEKVKNAKNWIIWSLVGVIVSMSSWFLVDIINNFGEIAAV